MQLLKHWLQDRIANLLQFVERQAARARFRRELKSGHLVLGKHTYGMPEVHHYQGSERRVLIGDYCSIARGVVFVTGGIHPTDWASTFPFRVMWNLPGKLEDGIPASKGDIHVGCDVWIGTDAMILSGVTIGHGAVIAARSVVTKDIPPYAVAAGSPARVIRYRFPPDQIQALLDLQWWSWPEHKVLEAVPLLSGPKISDFIRTNSR